MPFVSPKQRKFMWARHPEIAERWTREAGSKSIERPSLKALKRAASKTHAKP